LALSRAELPLLDLLEGHYSLKEALSFLEVPKKFQNIESNYKHMIFKISE